MNTWINCAHNYIDKLWFYHFVSKVQAVLICAIWKIVLRMRNALLCWILLRTIAMLFSMTCMLSFWLLSSAKSSQQHQLLCAIKLSLSCKSCSSSCLSHAPQFENFVTASVTCSLLCWQSSTSIQEFQKFSKSNSPSRWPSVECWVAFFTTSYGKSPCDGIGGTVKHL